MSTIKFYGACPSGIPQATAEVHADRLDTGALQVRVAMRALGPLDDPAMARAGRLVASLRLTPNEARKLAAALLASAEGHDAPAVVAIEPGAYAKAADFDGGRS